jgi:RNA polymerase sigma-70 factor (ECF subfamily)
LSATLITAPPHHADRSEQSSARLRGLVNEYIDFVARSLRSFGVSAAEVDDAVQQVFLVLDRKLDSVVVGSERAYLFRTAQRLAFRVRRSRASRNEVPVDEEATSVSAVGAPDQRLEREQGFRILQRILDDFAEELRSVFVLYEIEELTMVEIAELLDVPQGTVASRLRKARQEFQRRVRQYHTLEAAKLASGGV